MATGLSNTGFSAIQGVTPMWPPVAWPEQAFGLSAIFAGGAANIISQLGGALFAPTLSNCWQDFANTAGAYDKKVALIESEPARAHNYIPNSTFVGGTASAAATGWNRASSSGVTCAIVGMGVDADGYPYQDIRFSGTASSTSYPGYLMDKLAYALGTQISSSVKLSIVAGATTGFTVLSWRTYLYTAADAFVSTLLTTCDVLTQATATHTYYSAQNSKLDATAAKYASLLVAQVNIGQTVDITIRISQPQLELSRPRSFCPTYGTAIAPQATYFCGWQGTDVSKPYLRSADYSIVPFVSDTGETWTPNYTVIDAAGGFERSGSDAYWRNSAGTAGNYASTNDSAAASILGDGTWVFDGALLDWTPAVIGGPVSKISGTTGEYGISVLTDGTLRLTWYVAGVAKTATSTAAVGATDAVGCAIKVVRTIGIKVQFYKATDFNRATRTGTWVQIGDDVANTDAAATDTTNALLIGSLTAAANPVAGKIHYSAAWANTTGTGTPAWEFYPARDCTFPASPWLQFDGSNDYLVTNIIPGNYSAGFVCAGAVQTEAIGGTNALFGSSGSAAVKGMRLIVSTTNYAQLSRMDGSITTNATSTATITQNVPFVADADYQVTDARVRVNGANQHEALGDNTYTGTTQYALMGATNNLESGISATNYIRGNIHALVWLPVIPTEAQELAIRNYVASKTGVTL